MVCLSVCLSTFLSRSAADWTKEERQHDTSKFKKQFSLGLV